MNFEKTLSPNTAGNFFSLRKKKETVSLYQKRSPLFFDST